MTHTFETLLPADQAAAIRGLGETFGHFHMYVEAPIQEGIGRGLTRRHDALINYYNQQMKRGAVDTLDVIAARTNLFRGIYAELGEVRVPGCETLLEHEGYAEAARSITQRPLVRPTMLYANLLVPGQELAVHSDTPEYRGLDKTRCPEWLLVAMHHSGLFADYRVHVVAAVSFCGDCDGGDFIFYPDGPVGRVQHVPVRANSAVALSVDDIFHGVERVGGPDQAAPPIAVGNTLAYDGKGGWIVWAGDQQVVRYDWSEIRFSLQWKAQCFADEAEMAWADSGDDDLTLHGVTARLVDDLRERGRITGDVPDETALGLMIIQEYIEFPDA